MPKSKLSTEEMEGLKNTGVSVSEIAERAGTTDMGVRIRLSPGNNRRYGRETYRNLKNTEREEYIETQKKRIQEAQDRTALLAEKIGDRWEDEELEYLREWGQVNTTEELAIHLSRTYHAVGHIALRHKIPLRK